MPELERFDSLVLGGGNGGMYLAWHLAQSGQRTAVIERRWIGGSCPNIACLPSKNEIWSAKVADLMRRSARFGALTGSVAIDMAKVRARKRAMVDEMIELTLQQYKKTGAQFIMGNGHFVAPKTIEVDLNDGGVRLLAGDRVFVNLGTRAAIPPISGLEAAAPLTHIETLELDHTPSHLVVLGSGYVGLEMAQAFRRFGSRVTLLERGRQIASREDPDVADELRRIFTRDGIEIRLSSVIERVEGRSGRQVSLHLRTPSGEETIEGSDILVATGRIPNTAAIGLEKAGIQLDDRGYIKVNQRLETTAPQVWGIGECCAGHPQFTHVSFDDFRIIRDNLAGAERSTRGRLVPYCLFTDPQLARVGLSELEARQQGIEVRVARLPMDAVLRTHTTDERDGFMKALVGARDDRILGFTMIGSEAGEVMAAVQTAMLAGMPYTGLRDAVLAHPTMAEGLGALFASVPPQP
jgi:pyruvate/2-oxoglutarate dehydrogenase complex dihydrolipoamide dehydrogenase (E3) component